MVNTDMIIFYADGAGSVQDLYSTGYRTPEIDSSQDIDDLQVDIKNGVYTFTCWRALDTGDPKDFVIPLDDEFQIIWAEHSDNPDLVYHTGRGVTSIYIDSDGDEAEVGLELLIGKSH